MYTRSYLSLLHKINASRCHVAVFLFFFLFVISPSKKQLALYPCMVLGIHRNKTLSEEVVMQTAM